MVELKGRAQQEPDRLAATGINEPAEKDERKEGKYVQSLERALNILETMAAEGGEDALTYHRELE